MKRKELLQHTTCSLCRRKIGATGLPLFWVVRVERHGIKLDAVRRQDGLAGFLGSPALADVMGPGEELTEVLMPTVTLTVCEPCSTDKALPIIAAASEAEEGR